MVKPGWTNIEERLSQRGLGMEAVVEPAWSQRGASAEPDVLAAREREDGSDLCQGAAGGWCVHGCHSCTGQMGLGKEGARGVEGGAYASSPSPTRAQPWFFAGFRSQRATAAFMPTPAHSYSPWVAVSVVAVAEGDCAHKS